MKFDDTALFDVAGDDEFDEKEETNPKFNSKIEIPNNNLKTTSSSRFRPAFSSSTAAAA